MPQVLHPSGGRPYGRASGRKSYSTGRLFKDEKGLIHLRQIARNGLHRGYRPTLVVCVCETADFDLISDVFAIPEHEAASPTCIACVATELANGNRPSR